MEEMVVEGVVVVCVCLALSSPVPVYVDGIECPPVVPVGFYGAQTWVYSQH